MYAPWDLVAFFLILWTLVLGVWKNFHTYNSKSKIKVKPNGNFQLKKEIKEKCIEMFPVFYVEKAKKRNKER